MFSRARLKLTAFYAGTILIIVAFFSAGLFLIDDLDLFGLIDNAPAGDMKWNPSGGMELAPEGDHFNISQEFGEAIDRKLTAALLIIDPVIFLFTLTIGWLLAGKAIAPLQDSMKKQKRFVSDAAHELRTPLSIMKTGLETMEIGAKPTNQDYRELNGELLDEINRLTNLTNDLLLLSHGADESAETVVTALIDISEICAKMVHLMMPYASQNSVRLKQEIDPGIKALADNDQVSRLLLNLLKNAIDYNREDGEVLLRLTKNGKIIRLEISDTGIGIAPENLEHIYNRFYKVDDSRERSNSSSGLGLSIVNAIVHDHGGNINVESQIGVGTTVTVTLKAF